MNDTEVRAHCAARRACLTLSVACVREGAERGVALYQWHAPRWRGKEKTRAAIELTERVTTFALGAEKQVVSDRLTVPANFRNRLGPKFVALMENNMGFFFPRQITRKRERILQSQTSKIYFRDFSEEIGG